MLWKYIENIFKCPNSPVLCNQQSPQYWKHVGKKKNKKKLSNMLATSASLHAHR